MDIKQELLAQDQEAETLLAQELASGFWDAPERIRQMNELESQPYFSLLQRY